MFSTLWQLVPVVITWGFHFETPQTQVRVPGRPSLCFYFIFHFLGSEVSIVKPEVQEASQRSKLGSFVGVRSKVSTKILEKPSYLPA